MKNFRILFPVFILVILLSSCKKDDSAETIENTCEKTAFYISTIVCGGEGAGIKVDENGELITYVAQNFEDFFPTDEFELDDEITVEFEIIAYPPPGLLCGPTIVAPTIVLSCLEKVE